VSEQQSQAEKRWLENPLSGILPFTEKDDIIRPGRLRSPRQAMEAAQGAVARGEQRGVYIISTHADPDRQREMLALNVGGH